MSRGWYPDAATTRMLLAAAELGFDIHSLDTSWEDIRVGLREAGVKVPGTALSRGTGARPEPRS